MEKVEIIEFNGYQATIIIPEQPNGKWVWKTEFLYAFDQAERALTERGYTRVYYQISDKYGSPNAVELMSKFYHFVVERYELANKCHLFGFSRGGLYAFNFALACPDFVEKVYLDAPVLDMKTWPHKGSVEEAQMLEEYGLTKEELATLPVSPINHLDEFFALNLPLLVIAGGKDEIVPFDANAGRLLRYCQERGIHITSFVKEEGLHHPHSLEDVGPILQFIEGNSY